MTKHVLAVAAAATAAGLALSVSAAARPAADTARPQAAAAPAAAPTSRNVTLVGRTSLGGAGLNGDVAVLGDVALVGAGLVPNTGYHTERYNPLGCYGVTAKVVDLSNPRRPRVVATIPVPQGSAAMGVDLLRVRTPSFSGVLGAIAIDDGPSQAGPTGCAPAAGHTPPFYAHRGVAYYDLTRPRSPRFLGRYFADSETVPESAPPCAPPPDGDRTRCATGQHSVDLVQRGDGRVLSISTQPSALTIATPSGDVRVVDVTNPREPRQVGFFPPLDRRPSSFSPNGCAPFTNAHSAEFYAGGRRALVAYMDGGVYNLDLSNPAAPRALARIAYPETRAFEGNAGFVTTTRLGGRLLALVSEEDWWPSRTTLRVEGPAAVAGSMFACEGTPTVYDPDRNAQLHRKGGRISGELVYVGRGCAAGARAGADPYLADPAGKIAFLDSAKVGATQPDVPATGANCRFDARIKRAQDAGALAVVWARVQTRPFTASPQAIAWGGMPTDLTIPGFMVDEGNGNALRTTLCPALSEGRCTGGQTVTATLVDSKGAWGGLRVLDITRAARPRLVSVLRSPGTLVYPPRDLGVYAPGPATVAGSRAYVAWNSDGLRVLDLRGSRPREIGFYVPAGGTDPTGAIPAGTYVNGVAVSGNRIVAIDQHTGLYVLAYRDRTPPTAPRVAGPRGTRDTTPTFRFAAGDGESLPREIRFRCAFDRAPLRACAATHSERLSTGSHTLRVQAVDAAGNRSRVTRVTVAIG